MDNILSEFSLYKYDQQVLKFYIPFFESEEQAVEFINSVYDSCTVNHGKALQMLYQVERFINLTDEIYGPRPALDSLCIFFYRTCLESLYYLGNYKSKNTFFKCFSDCFSENSKNQLLNAFKLKWITDIETDETMFFYRDLSVFEILSVFKIIRDRFVHEGDYWTSQVFSRDDNSTWTVVLQTKERIINEIKDSNEKYYGFETSLQYDDFKKFFIEACICFIERYMSNYSNK